MRKWIFYAARITSSKSSIGVWQEGILDPKARPAKLWELSSQGTESSPKNPRLKYDISTMTAFATNDNDFKLVDGCLSWCETDQTNKEDQVIWNAKSRLN